MRSAAARSESLPNGACGQGVEHAIMRHFLEKLGFLLARIDQICTSIYGELSSGETLAQAEFLMLIGALPAASQAALARAAGVDTSTTAYILANLCSRGWVGRSANGSDRRCTVAILTPEGQARVGKVASDYASLQELLMAPLDPESRARLLEILENIVSTRADASAQGLGWAPSFLCRRALQVFQAQFVASLGEFNLTPRQFSLLFILTLVPDITQVGFARLFGLDPSTCAVIMRNLCKRGLLDSAPSHDDRRARQYRLTEAGRLMAEQGEPVASLSERLVFRDQPAADMRWLVGQLQLLVRFHSPRLRFPGALAADPG